MKITVIARTRNEQRNIGLFCRLYNWADEILVADGGSTDRTIEIAKSFSNVQVREFNKRIYKESPNLWRNPHGKHINFLVHWAEDEGADWIIFDDVDCFPNRFLIENSRQMLESSQFSFALVNRIYMYGINQYFRQLTLPNGKEWEKSASLYAWKSGQGFYADESDPWVHSFNFPIPEEYLYFYPPMAVIHDFYPEGDARQKKVKFYRTSGEQPECQDPKMGDTLPIEPWMTYE